MKKFTTQIILCLLAIIYTLSGCKTEESTEPDKEKLTEFITEISIGDNFGEYIAGDLPQSNSNTTSIVAGTHEIVEGGSLILRVQPSDLVNKLIISLKETDSDNGTLIEPGYFIIELTNDFKQTQVGKSGNEITYHRKIKKSKFDNILKSQVNQQFINETETYLLIITFSDEKVINDFSINVASANGNEIGEFIDHDVSVNYQASLSNSLQVSLNWVDLVDMDLHIETPNGNDIYYGEPLGQNGGILDLDSNPGCEYDYVNNENVTWLSNEPAKGSYIVRVDLWSACDKNQRFPFVISTRINGKTGTFSGNFTPSEETYGEAYSGRIITKLYYYEIPGTIPAIKQPTNMTCWATVATMLKSWKENKTYSIENAMEDVGLTWLNKFKNNEGLISSELNQFYNDMGLSSEPNACYTVDGFYSLLKYYGPLWVITNEGGLNVAIHARIVTGFYGDGSVDNTFLNIIDPGTGEKLTESYKGFIDKFEALAGSNFLQIAHY
jgi:papain like cysteine protease AvrRpt2